MCSPAASPVTVSRNGIFGSRVLTSTSKRCFSRSRTTSRWSWLTPLITSSCVCGSCAIFTVGSSSAILCKPLATFCSSPRVFGSMATPNIGCGKAGTGSRGASVRKATVSPMCRPSTFATATMSPGPASGTGTYCFPCTSSSWPIRTLLPVFTSISWWFGVSTPASTRMKLRCPTYLSFTTLNTKPEELRLVSVGSTAFMVPLCPTLMPLSTRLA